VSSVEAEMDMERHRTMHILDVSSVSRSSKFTKIVDGWGFAQTPLGEFTTLP